MNEDVVPILNIKTALEDAGFETSWQRPFFTWMHPEFREDKKAGFRDGSTVYVAGLPLPKGVPADLAEAEIRIYDDRLYFCFTLYFYTVLKDALEADDFRKIHEQHDREWFPKLRECYFDAGWPFMLEWDVEYDESIEDSLYGNLDLCEAGMVVNVVRALSNAVKEVVSDGVLI